MSTKKVLWIAAPALLALLLGGCNYSPEKSRYDLSRFRQDSGLTTVPDELRGLVASNDEAVRAILSQKPTGNLRFVVIGDTVSDGNAVFKGFLTEIAALEPRPSFIIHLGDRAAQPIIESYGAYLKDIQNPPCPILHVNGNHDLRDEGDRISQAFFGERDYFFDRGDIRFIFMDNSPEHGRKNGHGGFSRAQLVWLEDKLKAPQPARKFFFAHMPPRAPFKRIDPGIASLFTPPVDNEAEFLGLLTRYHVALAAFGHRHVHAEVLYHGILMVITGGGGQRTTFNPKVHEPRFTKKHHYTLVDIPSSGPLGSLEGILSCVGQGHETLSVLSFFQPDLLGGAEDGSVALRPYPDLAHVPLQPGPSPVPVTSAAAVRTPGAR